MPKGKDQFFAGSKDRTMTDQQDSGIGINTIGKQPGAKRKRKRFSNVNAGEGARAMAMNGMAKGGY